MRAYSASSGLYLLQPMPSHKKSELALLFIGSWEICLTTKEGIEEFRIFCWYGKNI